MFFVNLDMSDVIGMLGLPKALTAQAKQAGDALTAMTKNHILEEAQRKLHSRRSMFVEGLDSFQEDDHTWVINLDASVRWIDDGMQPHNMLDDLLSSPKAKTSKDGSKYLVVPFKHNKGATEMTPAQKNLNQTIKAEFKKFGVPYGTIEKGKDGSPKLGLLHSMDITQAPLKAMEGQGDGPIGSAIQGPTGIPYLKGIKVSQRMVKGKNGVESVRREIMTFRVASSKHGDENKAKKAAAPEGSVVKGRWDHPGTEAMNFMEEGAKWAREQWDTKISPQLLDSVIASIG